MGKHVQQGSLDPVYRTHDSGRQKQTAPAILVPVAEQAPPADRSMPMRSRPAVASVLVKQPSRSWAVP